MSRKSNEQILVAEYFDDEYKKQSSYKTKGAFFEYIVASKLLRKYDLDNDEIESGILGGTHDGGCDCCYIFYNGQLLSEDSDFPKGTRDGILTIEMIQAKKEDTFGEDVLLKWKDVCANLLDFNKEPSEFYKRYSDSVIELFIRIRKAYKYYARSSTNIEFMFSYASLGNQTSPNVIKQADELAERVSDLLLLSSSNVSVKFIGARELLEVWSTIEINERTIQFSDAPIAIQRKSDLIGLVNLFDYYQFLVDENDLLNKSIFEANVRDYQGNVGVNRSIRETLEQTGSSEDFWWLNNGITILASKAMQIAGGEVRLTEPSVVNGLQTSYELYDYIHSKEEGFRSDNRKVLIRIIVPESEKTRDRIIMATNNQTNVQKTSLRATDPIHLQIEQYFKPRNLYYDRRKNYYKNDSPYGERDGCRHACTAWGYCVPSVCSHSFPT